MHVSSFQPTGAFLHKANVFQLEHWELVSILSKLTQFS
jgi:hypothetical protein